MRKIKLMIYNNLIRFSQELVDRQKEIIQEILIEPYGTTRYEALKLHLTIVKLKNNLIKEIREVIN